MVSRKSFVTAVLTAASFFLFLLTLQRLVSRSSFSERPYYHKTTSSSTSKHAANSNANPDLPPSLCHDFPDTRNIQLVMKTGASEAFARLPTQKLTVQRCVADDVLVFSDMAQRVAGWDVRDSLVDVLPEVRDNNPEFDLYRRQQTCAVDLDRCLSLDAGGTASAGWTLDKYKNLHMAEQAWRERPARDWYVFVDADTYVLWRGLVTWLGHLDPNTKHYLGSVAYIHDKPFAHGGSGYVVSRAAMQALFDNNPGIANKMEEMTKKECCGDFVFSMTMKDAAGVDVKQMWPTINGERPMTIPYGPLEWCQPIVTMHHMNNGEISAFWDWEQQRGPTAPPVRMRDIYTAFVEPKLQARRDDWDNLSGDRYYIDIATPERWRDGNLDKNRIAGGSLNGAEEVAHKSPDNCARACESLPDSDCLQWRWQGGICTMSRTFTLGWPLQEEKDEEKRMTSGWAVERIKRWVKAQGKCGEVKWPGLEPEDGGG